MSLKCEVNGTADLFLYSIKNYIIHNKYSKPNTKLIIQQTSHV